MKLSSNSIAVYFLVVSLFLSGFIVQYVALALLLVIFISYNKPVIRTGAIMFVFIALFLLACISYFYNLYVGNADIYSILFWIISYCPPFILIFLISAPAFRLDFQSIYSFYKKLVYLQTFLLVIAAIKYGKYIVGDNASGTVGDANWVAFHICVVLIYEITAYMYKYKYMAAKVRNRSLLEITYFLLVFLIPESTANVGLMIIIFGIFFINKYIVYFLQPKRLILVLSGVLIVFFLFAQTSIYKRIMLSFVFLATTEDTQSYPYLSKFHTYKKLFKGDLYEDSNWLIGLGPSTFTSRSSVIRMPEERFSSFPIELPYFKSELFCEHISPIYANWRKTKASYGNFASPQTTVISVAVELGILGLVVFTLFFYFILQMNKRKNNYSEKNHLQAFVKYFTMYFILSLFHLNFWEYPVVSFTYIMFVFIIISGNDKGSLNSIKEK